MLEATDDLKQGDTAPVWVPYHSEVLNISYQLPNSWDVAERDGILYLTSPEQYALGDSPQQLVYFIYASEFKNPDGLPLEELVASNLSDELRQIFSYTTETIGHYTIHRTTHMPSAEGALTVFFATEGRFVSLALTPYRPENPFEAQEQYVRLFEQILDSVQLLDNE